MLPEQRFIEESASAVHGLKVTYDPNDGHRSLVKAGKTLKAK